MVYNHAFGQSPLVRLWWDAINNTTASNNPYFNSVARHPFNVGFDFNHESQATRDFVNRCIKFWLQEYHIDGIRFDLSKGFTQVNSGSDIGAWGRYDQSRINIWRYYSDQIRQYSPNSWLILEHFADNSEERELSNNGFLFWGNMNYAYSQGAMGYVANSDISGAFHGNRGWTQPNLVSYAESHDEERLMYRNLNFGSVTLNYNTRQPGVALDRMKLAAAFLYTIPGPKMLWQFGELGFDFSINWCTDGTINENCRTGDKPVRWDYLRQPDRFKLFQVFQALFRLKTQYNIFETGNFDLFQSGAVKRIRLNDGLNKVVVIGNFGTSNQSINPNFHRVARWYDFFAGDSLQVTQTSQTISLRPGEFRIYSTERFFPVNRDVLISSAQLDKVSANGNSVGAIYPNPSKGVFTIPMMLQNRGEETFIQIIDASGKMVDSQNLGYQEATNEVNNILFTPKVKLPFGIYYINILVGSDRFAQKLIVE
ncbi:MAG: hypothetical protein DDT42_01947 [candidate division WS2 bacterium]|uniref:Secretion system C-terminal sorting domain-containing protein n=1 Tax=Psychracetigena formicireducens TaxID=2986056 RepID=A0A9E2F7X7_PSYF1|nr:hypothetical protein [Candidatus Psychracetigena formicireducens]